MPQPCALCQLGNRRLPGREGACTCHLWPQFLALPFRCLSAVTKWSLKVWGWFTLCCVQRGVVGLGSGWRLKTTASSAGQYICYFGLGVNSLSSVRVGGDLAPGHSHTKAWYSAGLGTYVRGGPCPWAPQAGEKLMTPLSIRGKSTTRNYTGMWIFLPLCGLRSWEWCRTKVNRIIAAS